MYFHITVELTHYVNYCVKELIVILKINVIKN